MLFGCLRASVYGCDRCLEIFLVDRLTLPYTASYSNLHEHRAQTESAKEKRIMEKTINGTLCVLARCLSGEQFWMPKSVESLYWATDFYDAESAIELTQGYRYES